MNHTVLEALEAAADTFSKYALHHAEKGHTEKAEANHRLAVQMHHAIAAFPVVTESAQQALDSLEAEGYVEYGVLMYEPTRVAPRDVMAVTRYGSVFCMTLQLAHLDENEHTGA